MTRINAGIPPSQLTDEHLLAEHREIKRMPAVYEKMVKPIDVPEQFTLGTGHLKFFMDKMLYIKARYEAVHRECLLRGFDVQNYIPNFDKLPKRVMNRWEVTPEAKYLIRQRIADRISTSNKQWFHYRGRLLTKGDAISLLFGV